MVKDFAARHGSALRSLAAIAATLAAAAAVIVGVGAFVAREGSHADFTSQLAATPLAPTAGGRATITHNDAERAKRFAEKATADIEALERFLGR